MRKMLIAVVAAALVLSAPGAEASSDTRGTVLVPTDGVTRAHRCTYLLTGDQGTFGWTVPATPGANFSLDAVGDTAALQDFEIVFYQSLATCDANATVAEPAHVNAIGNESGVVPAGSTSAIVYLHEGANGSFSYNQS